MVLLKSGEYLHRRKSITGDQIAGKEISLPSMKIDRYNFVGYL